MRRNAAHGENTRLLMPPNNKKKPTRWHLTIKVSDDKFFTIEVSDDNLEAALSKLGVEMVRAKYVPEERFAGIAANEITNGFYLIDRSPAKTETAHAAE